MSFTDRLVLWLHIGFAIFTIGPVTVAIMSTPRYVRTRNLIVVRYLYRSTRVFALMSLGVLIIFIALPLAYFVNEAPDSGLRTPGLEPGVRSPEPA